MLAGLGVLVGMRSQEAAPLPEGTTAQGTGVADAGPADAAGADSAAADVAADAAADAAGPTPADAAADAAPAKLIDRTFRVVGMGWEIMAPALVANRGTTPGEGSLFTERGIEAHIRVASKVVDIERALARGGADDEGADVAIMPLPAFVGSYEQLRVLNPHIFFAIAWSHGHEALLSSEDDALTSLSRSGEVRLVGKEASPATFLAIFVLDLAGVPPERVDLVSPGDARAANVHLAAISRGGRESRPGGGDRSFVLTTADAPRLIPFVAVAPAGFIASEADVVRAFCQIWLDGMEELERDVPTAARRIASISGAPEALELLGGLGRIEAASLRENARIFGLSGRGAVSLPVLFQLTWRLWREANVVSAPAPEAAPLSTEVIAALVRTGSSIAEGSGAPPTVGTEPEGREGAVGSRSSEAILVHRLEGRRLDEDLLIERLGFLAGVFRPLPIRIALPGESSSEAEALIGRARDRYELDGERLTTTRRLPGPRAPAAIMLLTPP